MEIVICEPYISRLREELAIITFTNLEIRVDNKDYMLSNYENRSFELNTTTFDILDGHNRFSFINGKEIIVTIKELVEYKDNAQILVEKIEKLLIEENRKCYVSAEVMNDVMGGIFKLHESHTRQARVNLIDRALAEGDKELFERMVRMEVPECK